MVLYIRFLLYYQIRLKSFFAIKYRVVQLNFTPKVEVLCMLFVRSLSIFSITSVKLLIEYFNFRCKIQSDRSVFSYSFSPVRNAFADPYFCVEDVYDGSDVDCDDGNHYNSSLASDGGERSSHRMSGQIIQRGPT